MLSELLVIDIETVPQVEQYNSLSQQWQLLFAEKFSKTVPENENLAESYLQKAGIWAEFGKIVCISTAVFHIEPKKPMQLRVKSIYGDDEKKLLQEFIEVCNKMQHHNPNFMFCGHNIKEFDIPFIGRRMLVNGIALPNYFQLQSKKPWEVNMLDTLSWWKFGDHKNYTSLNLLAHALQVPSSKTNMNGSMVQDVYYKEKNLTKIVAYCQQDVVVTANIVLRFKQQPILNDSQVVLV
jgi:3'-5' exonuclease